MTVSRARFSLELLSVDSSSWTWYQWLRRLWRLQLWFNRRMFFNRLVWNRLEVGIFFSVPTSSSPLGTSTSWGITTCSGASTLIGCPSREDPGSLCMRGASSRARARDTGHRHTSCEHGWRPHKPGRGVQVRGTEVW